MIHYLRIVIQFNGYIFYKSSLNNFVRILSGLSSNSLIKVVVTKLIVNDIFFTFSADVCLFID